MSKVNFQNKLTIATMGCLPRKVVNTGKDGALGTMPLARIIGVVMGLKPAKDMNGEPMYALVGQFEGENIQPDNANKGNKFSSGKAYLPRGFQTMIEAKIMNAGSESLNVCFAVEIGVVEVAPGGKPSATGYEYTITDLSPIRGTDPLDELRLASGMTVAPATAPAQIEAPKTTVEETPAPKPGMRVAGGAAK